MVPVSNHLMDTESDFAPWDLSKAHISVSTPDSVARGLGGACATGTDTMALIQTSQIQAIMTVPHRLCLSLHSCQTALLAHVGT